MDKDYSTYKINQLLDDDYFVMSERYPTPENIKFWNNQIKRFPQLSREIELARKTIAAFREESVKKLSEEEIDTLWDRIKQENQHYNKKKDFFYHSKMVDCSLLCCYNCWRVDGNQV